MPVFISLVSTCGRALLQMVVEILTHLYCSAFPVVSGPLVDSETFTRNLRGCLLQIADEVLMKMRCLLSFYDGLPPLSLLSVVVLCLNLMYYSSM